MVKVVCLPQVARSLDQYHVVVLQHYETVVFEKLLQLDQVHSTPKHIRGIRGILYADSISRSEY